MSRTQTLAGFSSTHRISWCLPSPLVSSPLFNQLEHFSSGWSWRNSWRSGQIVYKSSGSDNSDPISRLLLTYQCLNLVFISWRSAKLLLLSCRSKEGHQYVWNYVQGPNPLLNSTLVLLYSCFLKHTAAFLVYDASKYHRQYNVKR